jgi:tetratricopeptide (TPR) repeat protein
LDKRNDEALQVLQQAVKSAPNNAAGHFQLGAAYMAKGNPGQAEAEWRETVRLRPNLIEGWVALGTRALQTADWRELESIGHRLRTTAPKRPEGYLFHATALMNQGDSEGAEADLNSLVQVDPKNPLGYAKLGQLKAAEKRWVDSQKFYQEALDRSPDFLDAIQGVVGVDSARGKSSDALQFIQTQINQSPSNAALYLLQGEVYLDNAKLPEAEQAFTKCIELDRQNLPAFILLAQVETALGKSADAAANYQNAIALSPNNVRLYTALGGTYEAQGSWQQAQSAYQQALAIRPDEPMSANNLAYLMLEHGGSVSVALTLAQTARRGLPNLPNSADTLGWAYYHTGAYSAAVPLFEDAIKNAPKNATYRYHLGLTYQKLSDDVRAKAQFEKVIDMSPNSPVADEARHAMNGDSGG